MSSIEKVKERIAQIAGSRKNTQASDIEWVVNQLAANGFNVRVRQNSHGVLYGVGRQRFGICTHHPGSKNIKPCYVDDFVSAMIELELYEQ
jgi:hypothetical protein